MYIRQFVLAAFAVIGLAACANQPAPPQAAPVVNNTNVVNVGSQQCCEQAQPVPPSVQQYAPPPPPPSVVRRPPPHPVSVARVAPPAPCATCGPMIERRITQCLGFNPKTGKFHYLDDQRRSFSAPFPYELPVGTTFFITSTGQFFWPNRRG